MDEKEFLAKYDDVKFTITLPFLQRASKKELIEFVMNLLAVRRVLGNHWTCKALDAIRNSVIHRYQITMEEMGMA